VKGEKRPSARAGSRSPRGPHRRAAAGTGSRTSHRASSSRGAKSSRGPNSSGSATNAARSAKTSARSAGPRRRWSADVMRHSDALDLERSVFKSGSPRHIAQSLKRSAEASHRRKGTPYQSAMSMLNFYVNRGGANLSTHRKDVLNRAKRELRHVFGRE